MHPSRASYRRQPHPRAAASRAATLLLLFVLSACGGGTPLQPPPTVVPVQMLDGLSGTATLRAADLGRIVEQEPNDFPEQPFVLAPFGAGCSFEVTGELGTTAARYGRVDVRDVFHVVCLHSQRVTLTVDFTPLDPEGSDPNELDVVVHLPGTFEPIASAAPGGPPAMLAFDATAGVRYEVLVDITSGHAAYTARFAASALPVPPAARRPAAIVRPAPTPHPAAPLVHPGEPACAPRRVLVRLREGCDADAFCARRGLALGRRLGTGSYCVGFDVPPEGCGPREAVGLCKRLADDPDVVWADPDWIVRPLGVPNDAYVNRQWNMRVIGAPSAWDITDGDPSVVVAVIDTGIIEHPDMAGQTVAGYDFITDPTISADGDGRDPDPTDQGDTADAGGLSAWHGTHVASIIGARRDDGAGVAGLAAGCRVMPVRTIGAGGGFVSDTVDAILWTAGLFTAGGRTLTPVAAANLSIGLEQDSPDLREACDRAANQGVFLVGAAGNNSGAVVYPAAYPSVFAVAAIDGDLTTTQYSSFGPEIDVAAPGGRPSYDQWCDGWADGVLGAVKDETADPPRMSHRYLVGTSQAAPHVAAAAALLLSLDPTLSLSDLRSILRGTALDLGVPGEDVATGTGLIQVHAAVESVLNRLGTPRVDPAYLMLPTTSYLFEGFRTTTTLPLYNGGGGVLLLTSVLGVTDDGAPWLLPVLESSSAINPPVRPDRLRIDVNRTEVPATPGRYSGSVLIRGAGGTLASVRVVLVVSEHVRVGREFAVTAFQSATGIATQSALAVPEWDYRYLLRAMPGGTYLLRAGEDIDANMTYCESFEACGWHGGPDAGDAVPVLFEPGQPVKRGLDIGLVLPP